MERERDTHRQTERNRSRQRVKETETNKYIHIYKERACRVTVRETDRVGASRRDLKKHDKSAFLELLSSSPLHRFL